MLPELPLTRQAGSIHCTVCDEDKPEEEFYPSARGKSNGQCKKCVKKAQQDREEGRVAEGKPRRSKRAKPASIDPEKLMQAMVGGDPRLELASKILAMQQRTIELLLREGGK